MANLSSQQLSISFLASYIGLFHMWGIIDHVDSSVLNYLNMLWIVVHLHLEFKVPVLKMHLCLILKTAHQGHSWLLSWCKSEQFYQLHWKYTNLHHLRRRPADFNQMLHVLQVKHVLKYLQTSVFTAQQPTLDNIQGHKSITTDQNPSPQWMLLLLCDYVW